jgi:stage II sporulation protein AA (anti-sigma F factor antagonist)
MAGRYDVHVSKGRAKRIRLRVAGELDLDAAPPLLDSILSAAMSHPTYEVVLDLDQVTFMDEEGLAALIDAHRRLRAHDVALVLAAASPPVRAVIERSNAAAELSVPPADASTATG